MSGVTQADRIIASEIVRHGAPGCGNGNKVVASDIKGGLHDDYMIVQAIRSYRETCITRLESDVEVLRSALQEIVHDMAEDDAAHALNWGHAKDALIAAREALSRISGEDRK